MSQSFGSATRQPNGQSPGVPSGSPTGSGFYGVSESGNTVTRDLQSSAGRAGARTAQSNLPDEFNPGSSLRTSQIAQRGIERLDQASLDALSQMSPGYGEYIQRRPSVLGTLLQRKDIASQTIAGHMMRQLAAEGISVEQGQVRDADREFRQQQAERENRRQDLETNIHFAQFMQKSIEPEKPNQYNTLAVNDRSKFTQDSVTAYDNAKATGHRAPWSLLVPKGPDGAEALNKFMENYVVSKATPESANKALMESKATGNPMDLSHLEYSSPVDQVQADRLEKKREQLAKETEQTRKGIHKQYFDLLSLADKAGEGTTAADKYQKMAESFAAQHPQELGEFTAGSGVAGGAGSSGGAAAAPTTPAAARPAPVQVSPDSIAWARQNVNSPNKTWADAAMKIMQQSGVAGATATPVAAPAAAPATSAASTTPTAPSAAPAAPATPTAPAPGSIEEYYQQRHEDYANFLKDQETKAKAANDNSAQAYFKQKNDEYQQFLKNRESAKGTAQAVSATVASQQNAGAVEGKVSGAIKTANQWLSSLPAPVQKIPAVKDLKAVDDSGKLPALTPAADRSAQAQAVFAQAGNPGAISPPFTPETSKLVTQTLKTMGGGVSAALNFIGEQGSAFMEAADPKDIVGDFKKVFDPIMDELSKTDKTVATMDVDGKPTPVTFNDLKAHLRLMLPAKRRSKITDDELNMMVTQWLHGSLTKVGGGA